MPPPGLTRTGTRTLRALAEAMAPGIEGLPPSGEEIDVAGRVERHSASMSPRVRFGLRLLLAAIEWSSFPRRFSGLRPGERADRLARWERSRLALRREMLMAAKLLVNIGYASAPAVRAAVGEEARCEADGGPDHPRGLGDTRPAGDGEDCEVAIVGSGAGGAAAASILAEAGHEVLVLEAGGAFDRDSYPADPLEAIGGLYRDGGLTIAEGRPAIPVPVGRAVGGTTVINSGTCFRAPDDVLASWSAQAGIPWATDLEGEYAAAEELLRVAPVDPDRMGRNGQLAMEGAARLGASGGPISRNAGRCHQCSSCPLGCPLDAKQGMHVSYLPRAVAAGARLRAGVRVDRIDASGGRVEALRCTVEGEDGPQPYTVRAGTVLLAGGAIGTPELLLRSGLGGRHVGRHLRVHPAAWIGARYPERVRGWEGVMQSYYVDQWKPQGLLLEATFTPLAFGGAWLPGTGEAHQRALLDFDRIGSIGVHLSDRSSGRVHSRRGRSRLTYRLTAADARRLRYGIARASELHFAAGATEVYPSIAGMGALRPGEVESLERTRITPGKLRLEAFHPMGTARMDADPARGVCGPDGSVRGVGGLYAVDASLFPGSVGVNPMMTVIALASRIAAGLRDRTRHSGSA